MTAPHLPAVERQTEKLSHAIADSAESALWVIRGPAAAGKSALLHELASRLEQGHLWPVLVAPPLGELDSGPSALLDIGAELHRRGVLNGDLESILLNPSVRWSVKLDNVGSWLHEQREKVVLLCDEPLGWHARAPDDAHFANRAGDVVDILLKSECRKVVAGSVPQTARVTERIDLQPASAPDTWLRDAPEWGDLAQHALELRGAVSDLERYSPLEVRLLVALVATGKAADAAAFLAIEGGRRELSRRLAERLHARRDLKPLTRVWSRLALARRPFEDALLAAVGEQKLQPFARDLLRRCLLYREADRWVLHDTLKADAREHRWLASGEVESTHRTLAAHYRSAFENGEHLTAALEAFHHSAHAHDPKAHESLKPFFVDQLNLLGKQLSLEARRTHTKGGYEAAAKVFDASITWDDQDDYAHHYLAFNLDVLGREAERVDRHYRRAIEIQPWGPWWHSRYINFLITRSRMKEARRAWSRALDVFRLPDESADPAIYRELHVWVARLLLHRGDLDFAKNVLESIPETTRTQEPALQALVRRLDVFLEARRTGAFLPGPSLRPRWWEDGPLLLRETEQKKKLTRWMAARVDAVGEDTVELRIATVDAKDVQEPSYDTMTVPLALAEKWLGSKRLAAGWFLEIGVYGGSRDPNTWVAVPHRDRAWTDADLPPLFPDPQRYLAAWTSKR